MSNELIKKIKSAGYWEIHIHPLTYKEKAVETRSKVKELVEKASVHLRGWDYPHYKNPYVVDDGVEDSVDWENHVEFWRMTQSLNFYHLLALREDRTDFSHYRNIWSSAKELENKKLLGVLGTLYTIVEVFEFTKRLSTQDIFEDDIVVSIKLHNLTGRELFVDGQNRIPFSYPRVANTNNPWVWKVEVTPSQISQKVEEFSLKAFLDLIDLFGWENPPIDVYKDDINKFLAGKI